MSHLKKVWEQGRKLHNNKKTSYSFNIGETEYSVADFINAAGGKLTEAKCSVGSVKKKIVTPKAEEKSVKKQSLSEGVLVAQYVPVINNRADGESLAEKIRRKRLLQESHQENLTE